MSSHRSLTVLALAAASALAACGPPKRAPVEVDWTFAGKSCAEANIATIQVDVAGELLTPNQFACQDSGGNVTTGANIGDYLLGNYQITVSGLDAQGNLITHATQVFAVANTQNKFQIDAGAGQSQTTLTLLWKFGGQTCAQAGVSSVRVKLDGQAITDGTSADLPCSTQGTDGTTIGPVSPGNHTLDLQGVKNGQVAYTLTGVSATATAGNDTELSPDLQPMTSTSASASVRWSFAHLGCADAKVNTVRVFVDGTQVPGDFPCSANGADAGLITGLSAGSHAITLQALRTGGAGTQLVYQTSAATTASFSTGLTTQVLVDAAASSPGVGGAKLLWAGSLCSGAATSISYALTSPGGTVTNGSSSCGAGSAGGIEFCNPVAAGCSAGSPGLTAGGWTITATATQGASTAHATNVAVAVPNAEENTTTVTFQ